MMIFFGRGNGPASYGNCPPNWRFNGQNFPQVPISGTSAATSNTVTETVTASDSYNIIATDNVAFTESQTESDAVNAKATDVLTLSESAAASDSIAGAATGLTNLNETGTASDTHQGIASGLGLLTETDTESDLYDSSQTQPGANSTTDTVTESDSETVIATMLGSVAEIVAANDNYGCQQNVFGAATTIPQAGPGDDYYRRRKYLDWLARQKRRKKAKLEKNQNRYAEKIIELAKPKAEAKPDYKPSEAAARNAAIDTILSLLPIPLSPIIQEAPYFELLELLNQLRVEEDDEIFMMLM